MKLTLFQALIAMIVSGLIVFSLRAFPFVLFSKREPPKLFRFIQRYIPPMMMAVLLVYCLKDVQFTRPPFSLPEIAALAFTVIAHVWKGNSMISIFGGTALFMVLSRIF